MAETVIDGSEKSPRFQGSGSRCQGPKIPSFHGSRFQSPGSRFRVQVIGPKVPSSKFPGSRSQVPSSKVSGSTSKFQVPSSRIQDSKIPRFWGARFKVSRSRFRVPGYSFELSR